MSVYEKLKQLLFEVFAAGYQKGYCSTDDLVTAYEEWWKTHMEG